MYGDTVALLGRLGPFPRHRHPLLSNIRSVLLRRVALGVTVLLEVALPADGA